MYWKGLILVAMEPKARAGVKSRGVAQHPFAEMAGQMQETLEAWNAANKALLSEVSQTNTHAKSIAESLAIISNSLNATGKFVKKFGPWAIAAGGAWIGASPAIVKALIAWVQTSH